MRGCTVSRYEQFETLIHLQRQSSKDFDPQFANSDFGSISDSLGRLSASSECVASHGVEKAGHMLGISWQDKVTNADVLSRAGLPTKHTLLRQRRLRWLGHVRRMGDGRIQKHILYGELALGRRTTCRPHLRYKDVCVRDMKAVDIDTLSWEGTAADHTKWRSALKQHLETGEDKLMTAASDKRARRQ